MKKGPKNVIVHERDAHKTSPFKYRLLCRKWEDDNKTKPDALFFCLKQMGPTIIFFCSFRTTDDTRRWTGH